MKIFISKFILIILICSNTFAQIDTTSLSYYPLNDGDYWEYLHEIEDYWFPYVTQRDFYSLLVVGDTILPIGKTFKIIKQSALDSTQYTDFIFERIDTITCNVYRYDEYRGIEFLIDSLKSHVGDTCLSTRVQYYFDFRSRTVCLANNPDTILGYKTISKEFYQFESLFPQEYKLSQNLGLTHSNVYFDFGKASDFLLYARINGTEYGTQVNSLHSESEPAIVEKFKLYQNYPNPFNPITHIQFLIPKQEFITLKIFNLQGKEVATLASDRLPAGRHSFTWDATGFASGVYIIRLQSRNQRQIKKCVLLK